LWQILQHLQTQATMKMEILTVNMQNIGVLAQKEAIAVRIITVLTLIYLPATFVSVSPHKCFLKWQIAKQPKTFFSTDVVKYQNQNQGTSQDTQASYSSFSEIAMFRWLQVALPLTAATLVLGWLGYKWAERRQRERLPFYTIELKTECDA
jgi:hypothetical protein